MNNTKLTWSPSFNANFFLPLSDETGVVGNCVSLKHELLSTAATCCTARFAALGTSVLPKGAEILEYDLSGETRTQRKYFFPSIEFEEKTGITGISKKWVLPEGQLPEQYERKVLRLTAFAYDVDPITYKRRKPHASEILSIRTEFDLLKKLNPELCELDIHGDKPIVLADVLWGVSSQLNLNDIKYYLEHVQPVFSLSKEEKGAFARSHLDDGTRIAVATGVKPRWCPSPDTTKEILEKYRMLGKERKLGWHSVASTGLNA